jgi:glutamate decarboxylase
MSLHER